MKTAISKVWTGTRWVTVLPKTNAQAVEYEAGKSVYDVVEPLKAKVDNIRYAVVFENYASLVEALKVYSPSMDIYRVGHDFFIKTLNVPDLWVSGFSEEYEDYTYTTDEAFVNSLNSSLGIQIGYTILSPLESKSVANLDNILDPIKNAIGTKLDKDTSTTSFTEVYAKNANGTQTMIKANSGLLADGAIAIRAYAGEILVPKEPFSDYGATSKTYVDTKLNTKLDKDTSATTHVKVYAKNTNGEQISISATANLVANAVPLRDTDGSISVPLTPSASGDAASKQYVDNKMSSKLTAKTYSSERTEVYAKSTGGDQAMLEVARTVVANSVAQRTATGQIRVAATPEGNYDATSKKYVDTKLAEIESDVDVSVTYDEETKSLNIGGDDNITADAIVHRNSNGSITVPLEPSADTDAASKKYVDNQKSMTCTYYDIDGGVRTPLKGVGYYMVYSDNPDLKLCLSDGTPKVEGAKQMQFMLAIQDKYPDGAYKACGQYWTGGDESTDIEGFRRAVDRAGYIYCPTRYTLCVMYKI